MDTQIKMRLQVELDLNQIALRGAAELLKERGYILDENEHSIGKKIAELVENGKPFVLDIHQEPVSLTALKGVLSPDAPTNKKPKDNSHWTPEKRAAYSERLRAQKAAEKAKAQEQEQEQEQEQGKEGLAATVEATPAPFPTPHQHYRATVVI